MVVGFPKSMNIGLAIDKKNGVESKVVGTQTVPDIRGDAFGTMNEKQGGSYKNIVRDIKKATNEWAGWGTALKPSFEPIIVARKPFKGSLVDNVIEYGVGGINIDECRVKTDEIRTGGRKESKAGTIYKDGRFPANTILTYDETDFEEVCDNSPITPKTTESFPNHEKSTTTSDIFNVNRWVHKSGYHYADNGGSASRYFYCAKASRKDRDEGLEGLEGLEGGTYKFRTDGSLDGKIPIRKNIHPTVKPTELMQYLIRLVTPKGGTILDPFMGSGSTGKATMYENKERNANYSFIGIEKEKEYIDIAEARIKFASDFKEEKEEKIINNNQISFDEVLN